jgi:transposase
MHYVTRFCTRLKLLYWDGTGLWLCTKRLERGRFSWPAAATTGEGRVVLSQEELTLLLGGIELRQTRRKAWYGRPAEKVTQAA